jgi:hypothetical protein
VIWTYSIVAVRIHSKLVSIQLAVHNLDSVQRDTLRRIYSYHHFVACNACGISRSQMQVDDLQALAWPWEYPLKVGAHGCMDTVS